MLQTGHIASALFDLLSERAENTTIQDVRIGLGYAGVRIAEGRLGLAAILRNELRRGCSLLDRAGTLAGSGAVELLRLVVDGRNPLEKALGLATANALSGPVEEPESDALEEMNLSPDDRVAMVGFFGPLLGRIRKRGASLDIIEKDPSMGPSSPVQERRKILGDCTIAIITATSILNDSIEEILNELNSPRHAVILGPSTPLCPEAFLGTPVTYLGGSVPRDPEKVLTIISEGGGTPAMRPCLKFVNLRLQGSDGSP
ncbi:MAG: DUF364 domain-containing protein [Deltaproteobacteria bacterium]|nr:DUF364 domain-containing protein [Deltaproteobacteria bacterium]